MGSILRDARSDVETGLLNGLALVEDLRGLPPESGACLVLVDVDHLLRLNTERGQAAGDEVLRQVAAAVGATPDAAVYRFGGDEFAVLTRSSCPLAVAQGVYAACSRALAAAGVSATCTVGFGCGHGRFSPAEVLWTAESAMRAGKAAGGDRVTPPPARPEAIAVGVPLLNHFLRRLDETLATMRSWREAALTDHITGLPNHRHIRHALGTALAEAIGTGRPMAVCFIDGDDLRRLNALSYDAGNALIGRLGRTLADQCRPPAVLGRWFSGDEFLLVLPAAGADLARAEAERLRAAVRVASAFWELPVTVSVGIAVHPAHGSDEDGLLTAAYAACSEAKRAGKDRVVVA